MKNPKLASFLRKNIEIMWGLITFTEKLTEKKGFQAFKLNRGVWPLNKLICTPLMLPPLEGILKTNVFKIFWGNPSCVK